MAKVSLRAYNREIETMIDRGQLDEAIANCHHIFKTYPKHLETYRLLGKAYLEYKRFKEAVDVFSRVLVSEPNDFVANVGMSIIRDDENKLDDAIWHMERAFETQPSNAAIQSELQRLYGRRDGVQPPRIRMTRGALAHMYVQGELYPQAISDIKSVLKYISRAATQLHMDHLPIKEIRPSHLLLLLEQCSRSKPHGRTIRTTCTSNISRFYSLTSRNIVR